MYLEKYESKFISPGYTAAATVKGKVGSSQVISRIIDDRKHDGSGN